jgi:hypothetical protein
VITNNLWDINGETLVTVVKKDKFSLISWFEQLKKINIADKLGGYTVKEWRQMIEDKVYDISDEVLEFVKPNIFERKMLKTKRPVKNRLLRNYVRNEGFLNACGGQRL